LRQANLRMTSIVATLQRFVQAERAATDEAHGVEIARFRATA